MVKVRPWCGQPSDRGRLKNRTERMLTAVDTIKENVCADKFPVSGTYGIRGEMRGRGDGEKWGWWGGGKWRARDKYVRRLGVGNVKPRDR